MYTKYDYNHLSKSQPNNQWRSVDYTDIIIEIYGDVITHINTVLSKSLQIMMMSLHTSTLSYLNRNKPISGGLQITLTSP